MATVNIHEAKTHLSKLVERVEAGEEIVIARHGRPVAKLVSLGQAARPRQFGVLKGKMRIAKDFNETPQWLIDLFERGEGAKLAWPKTGRPRPGARR